MNTASERVEITSEVLDDVSEKASAASPGPWAACIGSAGSRAWFDLAGGMPNVSRDGESCKCRMVYGNEGPPAAYALASEDESFTAGEGAPKEQARANARFIGIANPTIVLALVERIRELERERNAPDPLAQALNEGDGAYRP